MNCIKLSALFLLVFISSPQLSAQVTSTTVTFDKETLPALRLTIDAPIDEVEDEWEDFWDDRYDVDIDKLDKDRRSIAFKNDQVSLPLVSQKNVNLYSKLIDAENRTDVALALTFTGTDVITQNAHPKAYLAAEAILNEFRTRFYTSYFDGRIADVRDELEEAREKSQDDNKDAEKARRKIEKYEKKIADYTKRIEDMREEVGDELESAEERAARASELELKLRNLERQRAQYLR